MAPNSSRLRVHLWSIPSVRELTAANRVIKRRDDCGIVADVGAAGRMNRELLADCEQRGIVDRVDRTIRADQRGRVGFTETRSEDDGLREGVVEQVPTVELTVLAVGQDGLTLRDRRRRN